MWPDFFSIGVAELSSASVGADGVQGPMVVTPMLQALINEKVLSKEDYSDARTSSIGSNEAVIILNPTDCTLIGSDDESDNSGEDDDEEIYSSGFAINSNG